MRRRGVTATRDRLLARKRAIRARFPKRKGAALPWVAKRRKAKAARNKEYRKEAWVRKHQ